MFQPIRPLSVLVKFVNYEPPLKFEVDNADTTKLNESEPEESKKSVLNSEKSKIPIVKNIYNKDLQSKRKEHRTVI